MLTGMKRPPWPRRRAGLLADSGAAACRALAGGSPPGAAPPPHGCPAPADRRPGAVTLAPMTAAAGSGRVVLRAGHSRAAQDHCKGRAQGRVPPLRSGQTHDSDLSRQELGAYQEEQLAAAIPSPVPAWGRGMGRSASGLVRRGQSARVGAAGRRGRTIGGLAPGRCWNGYYRSLHLSCSWLRKRYGSCSCGSELVERVIFVWRRTLGRQ